MTTRFDAARADMEEAYDMLERHAQAPCTESEMRLADRMFKSAYARCEQIHLEETGRPLGHLPVPAPTARSYPYRGLDAWGGKVASDPYWKPVTLPAERSRI